MVSRATLHSMDIEMRLLRYLLLLLLFGISCGRVFADFKDYSNTSKDHAILSGIRLDALDVSFVEKRTVEVLGNKVEASVFDIRTVETVSFLDGVQPYPNVMKDINLYYELIVGEDKTRVVHDNAIEEIRSVFRDSKATSDNLKSIGISIKDASYLLYRGHFKTPDLIWFNEKFFHVRFKRFSERRRDRAATTGTFWQKKIRVYSDAGKMPINQTKIEFKEPFLKMFREGKFKKKEE